MSSVARKLLSHHPGALIGSQACSGQNSASTRLESVLSFSTVCSIILKQGHQRFQDLLEMCGCINDCLEQKSNQECTFWSNVL